MKVVRISLVCLSAWTFVTVSFSPAQEKETPKTIELSAIEKNAGANFGAWAVWRNDEKDTAIFLINQNTGLAIYLPWSSNGWINFRLKDGDWQVLYSKGDPEKQHRSNLKIEQFLDKKATGALKPGKHTFKEWTVTVTKDHLEFRNTAFDDRMTIRSGSGEVSHNGRMIGGK